MKTYSPITSDQERSDGNERRSSSRPVLEIKTRRNRLVKIAIQSAVSMTDQCPR